MLFYPSAIVIQCVFVGIKSLFIIFFSFVIVSEGLSVSPTHTNGSLRIDHKMQATKAHATQPMTLTKHLSIIDITSAERAMRAKTPENKVRRRLLAMPMVLQIILVALISIVFISSLCVKESDYLRPLDC